MADCIYLKTTDITEEGNEVLGGHPEYKFFCEKQKRNLFGPHISCVNCREKRLPTIKVVLIGYGGITSEENKKLFKDIFSRKDELDARITIASYIEENGKLVSKNPLIYELVNNFFNIAEIDTNRPWTICEYDGCEYIQYLDYDVINPEHNFCKFKEK